MSHEMNDAFLEGMQESFESAETPEERDAVIKSLRDTGFDAQADTLLANLALEDDALDE